MIKKLIWKPLPNDEEVGEAEDAYEVADVPGGVLVRSVRYSEAKGRYLVTSMAFVPAVTDKGGGP